MYHWIAELSPGQRALDVASGPGSFPADWFRGTLVWLDEDPDAFGTAAPVPPGPYFRVFGKGECLPFAAASFDLAICHHAMEHLTEVEGTLREIGRVLTPRGRLYVAVPNGYGLCDGVYRWVFEGGGHVNRFRRPELVERIERATGMRLVRWQKLYSSFVYLWRLRELLEKPPPDLAGRALALRRLPPEAITVAQKLLHLGTRLCDRLFGTDLAVYGWAFYFERDGGLPVEEPAYVNVCLYCGTGHPAASLTRVGRRHYVCPACNRGNPYFPPFGGAM